MSGPPSGSKSRLEEWPKVRRLLIDFEIRSPVMYTSKNALGLNWRWPRVRRLGLALTAGMATGLSAAEDKPATARLAGLGGDVSLRHETERAIQRGQAWLQSSQSSNGWWS